MSAALLASTAAMAGSAPERVGGWTITRDAPQSGAGCSMASGDGRGRLLVWLGDGEVRLDASSKVWFASGSLDYPVHLTIDADAPLDVRAPGAEPDRLNLAPNAELSTVAFVERLKTARSLAVRKDGNPGVETVTLDVSAFGIAYARLEGCAARARAGAAAALAERRARCEALAGAAAAAVGGRVSGGADADRIPVDAPEAHVLVTCGTADEAPTIELSSDGRGIPPALPAMAGRLAGVLAGRPAGVFSALPAACLAHIEGLALRRGGKHISYPDGATTLFEGEALARSLTLRCRFYGAAKVRPSFTVERR